MDRGALIFLEGLIGSGKSTLATKLAGLLELRAFQEPVEPDYLEKFYKDPKGLAFEFQLRQLARREGMHHMAQWEALNHTDFKGALLDRSLLGDRVFCKLHKQAGNISSDQWMTYEILFHNAWGRIFPPSLLIYLDVDPEIALERVKNRNRGAESGLSLSYLTDLKKGYLDLLSEIESKNHRWCNGIEVWRIPYNTDFLEVEPLARQIKEKLRMS